MKKFEINREALWAMEEYIKTSPDYTFEKFLKQNNAWHGVDDSRGEERMRIPCPFHKDKTPSLNFNESTKQWHCFSCNAGGGNVTSFIFEYNSKVLKSDAGFYRSMNNILLADRKMQLLIKFSTLFKEQVERDSDAPFRRRRFIPWKEQPLANYIELADVMKKQGMDSIEEIKLAIIYVQDGYSPTDVFKLLKGSNLEVATGSELEVFNIEELLGSFTMEGDVK